MNAQLSEEEQLDLSFPRCWVMSGPRDENPEAWTAVGYYTDGGYWQPIIDYPTQAEAAAMVHYLNGGNAPAVALDSIPKALVEMKMAAIRAELHRLPRDEKAPYTITVSDEQLYRIFQAHADDLMNRRHRRRVKA